MIFYIIKNNLKLMLRSRWILIIMILGPILTIAILSSAFEDLLKSYEGTDEFTVGYSIEDNSVFEAGLSQIEEAANKLSITMKEYPDGTPEKLMEQNSLAGFVELNEKDYVVYTSKNYMTEGITLEYFMSQVMKNIKSGMLETMVPGISDSEDFEIPVEEIEYMPAVNAKDYYGIVYIVYFIWCGIVCLASIFASEKKNGIDKKYQISGISNTRLFAAKWIPAVITIALEITVTIVVSTLLFGINWGNLPMTVLILFLTVLASASFSLMLYYLIQNIAVTIIAVFSIVWFLAFFGGCFETYMFSSCPEFLKELSPIYYVNRTIVEYSCMGKSEFLGICVIYLAVIIVVCAAAAIGIDTIQKRGRATK